MFMVLWLIGLQAPEESENRFPIVGINCVAAFK